MLGDATGIISELSLTRALTKYNGILAAAGATCDCAAAHDECMEADLCLAVQVPATQLATGLAVPI